MNRKLIFLSLSFYFLFGSGTAQNINYARQIIDSLAAPGMHGRGYVYHGDSIAGSYLRQQFDSLGLKKFGADYYQQFQIPINTLPGKIIFKAGGKALQSGSEFMVASFSKGTSGNFGLVKVLNDSTGRVLDSVIDLEATKNKFLLTDSFHKDFSGQDEIPFAGIIFLQDKKLWWHVSRAFEVKDYAVINVISEYFPKDTDSVYVDFKNRFLEHYSTQNVIGYIQGKTKPDSFIVFTAHYDHLGRMGEDTYFPGAHDNASGTAMITDLARHFSRPGNQPEYSMAFMAFAAEEAGLLGSSYYVEHPLFPLEKIRFVLNLDLVGTGSDGITVVNGSVFNEEYELLVDLNQRNEFLRKVRQRGEAANSDHYPFYRNGVPAFFIYSLGKEHQEYHTPDDKADALPLTEYEDIIRLLLQFVDNL